MKNLYEERIGVSARQANGLIGTVIEYKDNEHITVQLENGNQIHTKWRYFKAGEIRKTSENIEERVGKTVIQNCGKALTCIVYRTFSDCDFQFEDGKIVKHKGWDAFLKGHIGYIGKTAYGKIRIGAVKKQKNGQTATVIDYKDTAHITVRFDDKTELTTTWQLFKAGKIRTFRKSESFTRVGQRKKQNDGIWYRCTGTRKDGKCIFYNENAGTMTIQPWEHFEQGILPNYVKQKTDYVGKIVKQKSGLSATCISIADCNHADFRLEDGTVLTRPVAMFLKGQLPDPNSMRDKESRAGRKIRMKNGLDVICTAYRSATDLDVTFPDGQTVKNTSWIQVQRGTVMHPEFKNWRHADDFHGYDVTFAFTGKNGKTFYKCINKATKEQTIQQLIDLIPSEKA